ncbi:GNAT family N-acetyltransferase [Nocardia sp. IFM 10818]
MTNSETVSGVVLEAQLSEERLALLEERLDEYNSAHSPVLRRLNQLPEQGDEPVQVYLLQEGRMIGGLTGRTWADWLVIDMFWVHEEHRGGGLGGRLLAAAEEIAKARGCTRARTETWDFQSPKFYLGHGFRIVGEVPDFPPGAVEYILAKDLA